MTASDTFDPSQCGWSFETSPVQQIGEVSNALTPARSRQKSPLSQHGTTCAVDYYTIGGAEHPPHHPRRGGARNRVDRVSHSLSENQVAKLTAAARHAFVIGLPFTRMISIHWQAMGVPLSDMAKATGRFIDLMTKTLARHGSATAWIWVHENGPAIGGHCHVLAHVPAALVKRLSKLQRRWLKRIAGRPYRSRVIRSRPIGGWLGIENSNPNLHALNLHEALAYVLKQATAAAAIRFRMERLQPGGRVIGKRCGTSQNIGASARTQRNDYDKAVQPISRLQTHEYLAGSASAGRKHGRRHSTRNSGPQSSPRACGEGF